jgi:hypothetical protein
MTTAFKTLADTVLAALQAAPAVAGGRISLGRDMSTALDQASDINITLQLQDGEPFALSAGPTDWSVDVGVEVRARGSDTLDALAAIDPLIELVYARITAMALPAGITGLLAFRGRLDVQEAATPVAAWQMQLTVGLRTAPGSLALAP